jgi:hypothetical protein
LRGSSVLSSSITSTSWAGVAQAIALFVLPIWMAGYKTDVYLIISIFAFIPLIDKP